MQPNTICTVQTSTHVPLTQCVTWKVVKPKFFGTHTQSTHKNNPRSFVIGVRVYQPPQPQEKRTSAPRTAECRLPLLSPYAFQFSNAVIQVCEVKVNETTNLLATSYGVWHFWKYLSIYGLAAVILFQQITKCEMTSQGLASIWPIWHNASAYRRFSNFVGKCCVPCQLQQITWQCLRLITYWHISAHNVLHIISSITRARCQYRQSATIYDFGRSIQIWCGNPDFTHLTRLNSMARPCSTHTKLVSLVRSFSQFNEPFWFVEFVSMANDSSCKLI